MVCKFSIEEELQWTCEFLDIPYIQECLIKLWSLKRQTYVKRQCRKVYKINIKNEQLNIFDYAIKEDISI